MFCTDIAPPSHAYKRAWTILFHKNSIFLRTEIIANEVTGVFLVLVGLCGIHLIKVWFKDKRSELILEFPDFAFLKGKWKSKKSFVSDRIWKEIDWPIKEGWDDVKGLTSIRQTL